MGRRVSLVIICLALVAAFACSAVPDLPAADTTKTTTAATTSPPARRPVILLHGTFAMTDWTVIEAALLARGHPTFHFDYGNRGTDEIARSANGLAAFVGDVRSLTGEQRVSLIGHSQGGLVARHYVRFLGGREHVDDLIALAPPNHGTTSPMIGIVGLFGTACRACTDQQAGSPFLTALNDGDETPPPVEYTVIQTRYDRVVAPYTSAFLKGPSARVTNITLQDRCPNDFIGHLNIPSDAVAVQWVEHALDGAGPPDPEADLSC